MKLSKIRKVSYDSHHQMDEYYEEVERIFEARFIEYEEGEIKHEYFEFFHKQPEEALWEGIDVVEVSLPRDYVNESRLKEYTPKSGAISVHMTSTTMQIELHREYIDHNSDIWEQVNNGVRFLFEMQFFKLPLKKTRTERKTPYEREGINTELIAMMPTYYPVVSEYTFDEEERLDSCEEFWKLILAKMKISRLELFFDFTFPIIEMVSRKQYYQYGDSWYSKEYTNSKAMRKDKKSLLCIYDKKRQLKEAKHKEIEEPIRMRFEIRLYRGTDSKILGDENLLRRNYEDLVKELTHVIIMKFKRIELVFKKTQIKKLPKENHLKYILDKYIEYRSKK